MSHTACIISLKQQFLTNNASANPQTHLSLPHHWKFQESTHTCAISNPGAIIYHSELDAAANIHRAQRPLPDLRLRHVQPSDLQKHEISSHRIGHSYFCRRVEITECNVTLFQPRESRSWMRARHVLRPVCSPCFFLCRFNGSCFLFSLRGSLVSSERSSFVTIISWMWLEVLKSKYFIFEKCLHAQFLR